MDNWWLAGPFRKTLRDLRGALIGFSVAALLLMTVDIVAYHVTLGAGAPERDSQIVQLRRLAASFSYLIGEVLPLDTVAGFLSLRLLTTLPLLLGIWATVVGAGLLRGEEEQGQMDVHLAAPIRRTRLLAAKWGAFSVACAVIALVVTLGLVIIGGLAGEPLPADRDALAALNALTMVWMWGGIALLLGQLCATRRLAAGSAVGLLFLSYLLETNLGRVAGYKAITALLPMHYWLANRPLVPGRTFDTAAYAVLLGLGLLATGAAAALFQRRDVGAVFRLWPATRRAGNGGTLLGLSSLFTRALRDMSLSAVAWAGFLAGYTLLITAALSDLIEPIRTLARSPLGKMFLNGMDTTMSVLQAAYWSFVVLILAGFAVLQVAAWTAEEEAGRLELVLSTPQPRPRLLLARAVALLVWTAAIAAAVGGVLLLGDQIYALHLDSAGLPGALLGLLPFVLVISSAGWALAAHLKRPGGAVPVVAAVVVAMFILDALAPLLQLPDWVARLSIFTQYGHPLIVGWQADGLAVLTLASVALLALALWGIARRDITR
ncbi:MAG: ABC transporter permease [Chloroflexota bacterium]|nr:ABC transporter permease [Chloroflexota bacterium]